jgi:hypothetical protein
VRAEPPEIAPGDTTTLDALVALPPAIATDGGSSAPSYLWLACSETPGQQLPSPCGVTAGGNGGPDAFGTAAPPLCDVQPDAPFCLAGDTASVRYTAPAITLAPDEEAQIIITLVVADDTVGGATGCALSAAQSGTGAPVAPPGAPEDYNAVDHCIIALKRLTVSHATAPNHNPALYNFTLGGLSLPDDAARYTVTPEGAASQPLATVRCTGDDGMSLRCPPGSGAEVEPDGTVEPLYVSWFLSAGSISSSRTSFQPADCTGDCLKMDVAPDASTDWSPPDTADAATYAPTGTIDFWAVVRDDRGGVGWLQGSASR